MKSMNDNRIDHWCVGLHRIFRSNKGKFTVSYWTHFNDLNPNNLSSSERTKLNRFVDLHSKRYLRNHAKKLIKTSSEILLREVLKLEHEYSQIIQLFSLKAESLRQWFRTIVIGPIHERIVLKIRSSIQSEVENIDSSMDYVLDSFIDMLSRYGFYEKLFENVFLSYFQSIPNLKFCKLKKFEDGSIKKGTLKLIKTEILRHIFLLNNPLKSLINVQHEYGINYWEFDDGEKRAQVLKEVEDQIRVHINQHWAILCYYTKFNCFQSYLRATDF
ncbi:hypothetical protein ACOME3_002654 [Neoechinorhynchus agilis]